MNRNIINIQKLKQVFVLLVLLLSMFCVFMNPANAYADDGYTVTYDANGGGIFSDGSTQNVVMYDYPALETTTRISKTSNVNSDGSSYSGGYGNNKSVTDIITIPGATELRVTITCQTESINYDWVCVYDGSVTPSTSNYSKSVSGKLGGSTKITKTFTIPGNTVQFFLRSDNSADSYFGYYAIIEGESFVSKVNKGNYEIPTSSSDNPYIGFLGWYTDTECTEGNEFDANTVSSDIIVYAKWDEDLIASGICGGCSWKIYNTNGAMRIYPTNGASGTLDSITAIENWPWHTLIDCVKSVTVEDGVIGNTSLLGMFCEMKNCTEMDLSGLDTSRVENMRSMFSGCSKLANLDVSGFNTRSVTNMSSIFSDCSKLKSMDLSAWNTSSVTNMNFMFDGCGDLTILDVFGWNTSSVTSMSYMFQDCYDLTTLDVSGWNTGSVTDMSYMFADCYSFTTLDVSGWNTGSVTDMNNMFSHCHLTNIDVSGWNTSKVADMTSMFYDSSLASLNMFNWDTSSVTKMNSMFSSCDNLCEIVFGEKFAFIGTKHGFNDSSSYPVFDTWVKIRTADGTEINNATSYTSNEMSALTNDALSGTWRSIMIQAIYSEDDNSLTFVDGLAVLVGETYNEKTATKIYTGFEDEVYFYYNYNYLPWHNDKPLIQKVIVHNKVSPTSTTYWFQNMNNCTEMDLRNLDTSSVRNMESMFQSCSSLVSLDLSGFDTSSVTNMDAMFSGCSSLVNLDVSTFNTGSVKTMFSMFSGCENLTNLNLSGFDTSSVTETTYMFQNLKSLSKITFGERFAFFDDGVAYGHCFAQTGDNWVKTRNADGSKTYDKTEYTGSQIAALNNTDTTPLLAGTWVKYGIEYTTNPDGSVEYISEDDSWTIVSDTIWKYTFEVFDDSLLYYLYEEIINGYNSEAMNPYYIEINDNMATITNTAEAIEIGKLMISKTVEGIDADDEFEFTITLTGNDISGKQIFNSVIFNDGVGKFLLKDGESKIFELPVGTIFSIKESMVLNYNSEINNANGIITKENMAHVTAVNTYVEEPVIEPEENAVNITVQKTAENYEETSKFVINCAFEDLKANTEYILSNGITFISDSKGNGFCSIEISVNDEIVIYNIPEGATYQFTENAGEYISSYSIINNGNAGDSTIIKKTGVNFEKHVSIFTEKETADAGEEIVVTFHNKFETVQNLTVSKNVKEELENGSLIDCNVDDEFEFTIIFTNMVEGDSFNSTIGKVIADEYGEAYKTFRLKNGESAEFYNIPVDVEYVVEESANKYKPTYMITGLGVVNNANEAKVKTNLSTAIESIETNENGSVVFTNIKPFSRNKAIHLVKTINTLDNPNIITALQNNRMYHLDGAEYELVINGEVVETLVTDVNGEATSTQVFADGTTGTIREVKAPDGFLLDTEEYDFTIDSLDGETYCEVAVSDIPTFDPITIMIRKKDSVTGTAPQGGATFEGAVFKYEYYDNINWDGYPTRTWYFKTNAMGLHGYHPDYLADGYTSDELYTSGNNVYTIPLGSIKITEVVSPAGYKAMPVLYATITQDSMGAQARWQFTQETLEFLITGTEGLYEGIEPIDEEKFGSLVVQKAVNESGFAKPTDDATFAGCEFTIYNKSVNPVKIGDNEIANTGEACLVITVGADGQATTDAVLPVGTYEVKETKGNEFYQCNTTWSYTFTVDGTEDNPMFTATCRNDAIISTQNITLKKVVSNPDVLFGNEVFTINVEFSGLETNKTYNMSNGNSFTSDANGCATYTARIAHNEEVVFQDIPVGANYKFTEVAGEYKASYKIEDNNKN